MTNITNIYTLFTGALSEELNIDYTTAEKIVSWLTSEGVLNNDMLTETYGPVAGTHSANDNPALTLVA